MRIAIVGKGGSGKSTVAAAVIQCLREMPQNTVWAIDADINMHLGPLLGIETAGDPSKHLSHPLAIETIKKYLIGKNARIASLAAFRKTTPPGSGSNLIAIHQLGHTPLSDFDFGKAPFHLMA